MARNYWATFHVSRKKTNVLCFENGYYGALSLSENSVVGPRASVFSPAKDGEAGDVCFIVDTAGCRQADNSGCLDPTVAAKPLINKTVQEKGPLEARSGFPTEPG